MPARTVNFEKARRSLLADKRFNHPEADAIAMRYLPRLIHLVHSKTERQIEYVDILRLQITLGLEALANGYPHLPETDEVKDARRSLRRMLHKQECELGRLPRVSHENIEQGNLESILTTAAIKQLRKRDWIISYGELIEIDPGCILVALATYWAHS